MRCLLCIYLEANENIDQIDKEAIAALEMKKCHKIKKILNKKNKRVQRRVLSSPKEKNEYSSKCPNALKNIIQDAKQKFEVSIIDSKKLYNFCSKIANKVSTKLHEVHSPRAQESSNNTKMENNMLKISRRSNLQTTAFCKIRTGYKNESDLLELNSQNLSTRVLDKEGCQASYKLVNEAVRSKVRTTLVNKHMLFTFNPLKLRLKSPIARQIKCLI